MLAAAKIIGAGLATIGLAGAGVGVGIVYAILGFALTEALALFALMMAFLLLYGT
uniref:ATP synthase F0 subunit 9 n=1 Tax=Rhizophagus irregularis TaxID=588596 RepID=S4TDI0_9GLOM|nr:ATP synthase F0 subunit 9 [Rhizophagus irregularis]